MAQPTHDQNRPASHGGDEAAGQVPAYRSDRRIRNDEFRSSHPARRHKRFGRDGPSRLREKPTPDRHSLNFRQATWWRPLRRPAKCTRPCRPPKIALAVPKMILFNPFSARRREFAPHLPFVCIAHLIVCNANCISPLERKFEMPEKKMLSSLDDHLFAGARIAWPEPT